MARYYRTLFDYFTSKKAVKYIDMNESECPDPELYELTTEPVLSKTAKGGQKCLICNNNVADCDLTIQSVVATAKGRIPIKDIIFSMGATLKKVSIYLFNVIINKL